MLYAPTSIRRSCLPAEKFKEVKLPNPGGNDHYLQFVEACRGNGKTSAPFDYSGPLTESVLLGCLATRFPETTLQWDPVSAAESPTLMTPTPSSAAAIARAGKSTDSEDFEAASRLQFVLPPRHLRYNIVDDHEHPRDGS